MRGANSARKAIALVGRRVTCECCGRRSGRFLPYGHPPRPQARWVHRGSLERHRILWPHLQQTIKLGDRDLHLSPEPIIARNITTQMQVRYTAADLTPSHSWLAKDVEIVQADIAHQPWSDGSFDVVIVGHVLEFVHDDLQAMRELRRVVADDGVVVVQESHDPTLETTCENPAQAAEPTNASTAGSPESLATGRLQVQTFHYEAGPGNEVYEARPR